MIRTANLSKRFGGVEAVQSLNLMVREGTAYGLIGPNGAGKTTTMAMLATLLAPSEGKAWIGGWEVREHPDEVRRIIGYMPDFFGVYDQLTAEEYSAFFRCRVRDRAVPARGHYNPAVGAGPLDG